MASQLFIYSTRPSPSRHLARSKHGKQIAFTFVVYLFAQRHKSMCPIKVSKVPIGAVWINCFKRKKSERETIEWRRKVFSLNELRPVAKSFLRSLRVEFLLMKFLSYGTCCEAWERKLMNTRSDQSFSVVPERKLRLKRFLIPFVTRWRWWEKFLSFVKSRRNFSIVEFFENSS